MKRILAASSIAAFVLVGLAGTASAAPSEAACFAQIHKTVNSEWLEGFANVGELVKSAGGQGTNAAAAGFCE